jgi:hypothetical protein
MQAAVVALIAVFIGVFLGRFGAGIPYLLIMGDAFVMGAFIIASTSLLLFLKAKLFGIDEIAWDGR